MTIDPNDTNILDRAYHDLVNRAVQLSAEQRAELIRTLMLTLRLEERQPRALSVGSYIYGERGEQIGGVTMINHVAPLVSLMRIHLEVTRETREESYPEMLKGIYK